MINETTIRRAHPGDAGAIAKIHVDSWRSTYKEILPRAFLNNLNHRRIEREICIGLLAPQMLWLVVEEQGGRPVGYICGGPERSNNEIYRSEIYELYVAPGFQRRGFGRRLLSVLADHLYARNFYSIMVWVLAGNPSRRFYEKTGGLYVGAKSIVFAGRPLQAIAYGWFDIAQSFALPQA
ncbi:MAG: GNAT family N-acetyltransferase [Desulfosarcinaceae bacterium]|nr:GNAT family N-acetyltransferase [Desulfosarcinaceae bacterium]